MMPSVAGVLTVIVLAAPILAAPAMAGPDAQRAEPRVIEVVARKFAFVPARIEVTEGETVRLLVRSADGVHGLSIKKLRIAEELPRGSEPIAIEFTATAVGEFEILCSEYCGKGHQDMKGKLVVRAREARPAR